MAQIVEELPFQFVSGSTCLDFVNTVSWPSLDNERLVTFDDAVQWAVSARLLRTADQRRLRSVASRNVRAARGELLALRKVRALLRAIFTPLALGRKARPADVRAFNRALRNTLREVQVVARRQTFAWSPELRWADRQSIRRAVVWDAAKLLTSARLHRLRKCANPACGWVFLDESRRNNRRWCSMEGCGSRAKARRYYDRFRVKAIRTSSRRRRPSGRA
jgi:predicted RNA-binding Zn ribbon-like protein